MVRRVVFVTGFVTEVVIKPPRVQGLAAYSVALEGVAERMSASAMSVVFR